MCKVQHEEAMGAEPAKSPASEAQMSRVRTPPPRDRLPRSRSVLRSPDEVPSLAPPHPSRPQTGHPGLCSSVFLRNVRWRSFGRPGKSKSHSFS